MFYGTWAVKQIVSESFCVILRSVCYHATCCTVTTRRRADPFYFAFTLPQLGTGRGGGGWVGFPVRVLVSSSGCTCWLGVSGGSCPHRWPTDGGETWFWWVRVGLSFLCSGVLVQALGVPPTPVPSCLTPKGGGGSQSSAVRGQRFPEAHISSGAGSRVQPSVPVVAGPWSELVPLRLRPAAAGRAAVASVWYGSIPPPPRWSGLWLWTLSSERE